jgi:hypothetical protein
MSTLVVLLSDSSGNRAAIVGWIALVVAGVVLVGLVIISAVVAIEEAWERLNNWRRRNPHIHLGWMLFTLGIVLLALGYIFSNWFVGTAGAIVLVFLWRMNENAPGI